MKIAIVGLANSHPFTDARHLRENHGAEFVVFDDSKRRIQEFQEQQPDAEVADDLEGLLAAGPRAAVITVHPPQINDLVEAFLEANIPVYVSKPAAVTQEQLARLDEILRGREEPFLTASVLRFASGLEALPRLDAIDAPHVIANHHIDYWRRPESRWQDAPDIGGGLIPMMGVHAFELLELVLGPTMRVTSCVTTRLGKSDLTSPDIATGTAANDLGVIATFEINGMSAGQSYGVEYMHDGEHRSLTLGEGEDPYGFATAAELVAHLANGGDTAIPWEDSRAVLQAAVDARAYASRTTAG